MPALLLWIGRRAQEVFWDSGCSLCSLDQAGYGPAGSIAWDTFLHKLVFPSGWQPKRVAQFTPSLRGRL